MQDIIEKIISNVEKATRAVGEKATDVVEITKTKIAISNAESKIEDIINEMGRMVYDAYKSGKGNAELIEEKCAEIDDLYREVATKRDQYARLRNLKRCPECEHENDSEAMFCNKCGAKLPDVVAYEVDEMPESSHKEEKIVDTDDVDDENIDD